jgi:hypothetical protein
MDPMTWLADRTRSAPPVLRARLLEHVAGAVSESGTAASLARAGSTALERVTETPGDRSVALDLLAADGLITLALLWCAEHEPASLATLARLLTEPARPRD